MMTDSIDSLLIDVRANTQAFAADVQAMRSTFDGTLVDGLGKAGEALERGLLGAIRKGSLGFEDLRRIALNVIDQIAAQAVQGLFGAGGGGGAASVLNLGSLVSAIFGLPGRATGGPVSPGRGYLVGERGPELFVPTSAGRVEAGVSSAQARDVRVSITIAAPHGTSAPQALQRSSRQVASAVRRAPRTFRFLTKESTMAFWLAAKREGQHRDWLARFDPRFWSVNFPRPMLAALTTPAPDALRVDATFLREGDLAGVIWDSTDSLDHPLLAYKTVRDYARCTLSFRWQSAGVLPLDAVNGPTLTIEGRDAAGAPQTWFVRLWNYATGTPSDAQIELPFSELASGWAADGDAVYPADIDRMFISLVAQGYVQGSTAPLAAPVEGWIELTGIACDGAHTVIEIGDVIVPPHGLALATAYDDCTNQSPARLVRTALQLGYRGSLLHYVGMSHYMRLTAQGGAFLPAPSGDPLATPARRWHEAFLAKAKDAGFSPILSLSYELLAELCPDAWQQRASNGDPARTGWVPPSALLSPANTAAMAWLRASGALFASMMKVAGVPVRFQIGEPWWWIMADGRPCLYDDAAKAAFGGDPKVIDTMRAPLNAQRKALLDQAGALLANSTAALRDAVRAAVTPVPAEVLLLTFLPSVLDPAMPEARRANLPLGWASPAFDRLQVEDYDWLTSGAEASRRDGYATINTRLGYPAAAQDYLAGFVLAPDGGTSWQRIDAGCDEAFARAAHEVFVWAAPQVCRDGFVRLPPPSEDETMLAFDDLPYPLALGRDATVIPEFSTSVAVTASGFERRNSLWSDARLRFDVGPGIRSEAELGELLGFYRARRGAARGFRLRDPSDFSSNAMIGVPTMSDQLLGTGDGVQTRFALLKRYGEGADAQLRKITRPVASSLLVSLDGVAASAGWTLDPLGELVFTTAPTSGKEVRAGFLFDVPVRFAEDRLEISGAAFAAGEAPSVPIVEVRETA